MFVPAAGGGGDGGGGGGGGGSIPNGMGLCLSVAEHPPT